MKVIAQRNYNTSYVSILSYIVTTLCATMYLIFWKGWFVWDQNMLYSTALYGFLNTVFYFISTLTRVESLKHIDTTIFFPLYKTFLPIIITLISFFYFQESLTSQEGIWIVCGLMIPLLLLNKQENTVQKNLKLWVVLVVITSMLATVAWVVPKLIHTQGLDIDLFVFFGSLSWAIVASFSYLIWKKSTAQKVYSKEWIYMFAVVLGVFQFLGFLCYSYATQWNLAIAMTINSFSILIPIILSVIFYKEEMTYKKAFVIFLSIVSVILFI